MMGIILEANSSIYFSDLEKVHKGVVMFECFKQRTIKTIVIEDPQRKELLLDGRLCPQWEWDAEVLEVYDYKQIEGEWCKVKYDYYKPHLHYKFTDVPFQGAPKLYSEDIYQHLIEKK